MSLLKSVFEKKAAFVGYLTGGDGGIQFSVEAGLALLEGGVDILELGVPFSDPVADGPTIQKACQRALQCRTTPDSILEIASQIKRHSPSAPLVLFSYFNPVLQGGESFLKSAKKAGLDGMLLLDLPFNHSFYNIHTELDPILVASPSIPSSRLEQIVQKGRGFIYYACQKGTTGIRAALPDDLTLQIQRIKKLTQTPVVVGFGISNRESAANAIQHANGFVVGSAFVKMIEEGATPDQLRKTAMSIDPRKIEKE